MTCQEHEDHIAELKRVSIESEERGRRAGIAACVKALRKDAETITALKIASTTAASKEGRRLEARARELYCASDKLEITLGTTEAKLVERAVQQTTCKDCGYDSGLPHEPFTDSNGVVMCRDASGEPAVQSTVGRPVNKTTIE